MPDKNKVVIFPKWRKSLENESLLALKQKKYMNALHKLDKLLAYKVNSHEIRMGKLICLMELERLEEAQDFCEEVLRNENKHYFEYVHIYLSILFQTAQYALLVEQVEHALTNKLLPISMKDQFKQLYEMSREMLEGENIARSSEYISLLKIAIKEKNYVKQWQLIENFRKMKMKPSNEMLSYLVDEEIHPVVKTAIFLLLQDYGVSQAVTVKKLDLEISIIPIEIENIRSHHVMKEILFLINELEQENPSLFILLHQMLYRYFYIRYPILPSIKDAQLISKALQEIGNELLHKKTNQENNEMMKYIEELKMCEALYLSVIEE